MRSAVFLAAMMPARRATSIAFPFGSLPSAIRAIVPGESRTNPSETARLAVGGFSETSTMRVLPAASMWVNRFGFGSLAIVSLPPSLEEVGEKHGIHRFTRGHRIPHPRENDRGVAPGE